MADVPHVAVTLTQFWHQVPGGTATSIERLVGALESTGRVRITGVGPRGDLRQPMSLGAPRTSARHSLPASMIYLPMPMPFLYDAWTYGRGPGVEDRGDFDLVHVTVPVTPPRGSLPLIATVHDLFPLTHPEFFSPRGVGIMAKGLASIRDRAAKVLVSTATVANECIRNGFDSSRIEVVPFGIDQVEVSATQRTRVLAKYDLKPPYILFVGTIEPRKNLRLLADAMIRLNDPEVSLVIAGPKGWDGSAGESAMPAPTEVPSPVVQLGYVPDADLPVLQNAAAAFCFPSLVEGFGLPVLEAMAAGSVVITSNVSATAEVAGDGALLVDPNDAAGMARSIRQVVDDESAAADLRRAARARSLEFNWASSADGVVDAYRSILP